MTDIERLAEIRRLNEEGVLSFPIDTIHFLLALLDHACEQRDQDSQKLESARDHYRTECEALLAERDELLETAKGLRDALRLLTQQLRALALFPPASMDAMMAEIVTNAEKALGEDTQREQAAPHGAVDSEVL
jgi:DNA-binding transcriptional MerR regulator